MITEELLLSIATGTTPTFVPAQNVYRVRQGDTTTKMRRAKGSEAYQWVRVDGEYHQFCAADLPTPTDIELASHGKGTWSAAYARMWIHGFEKKGRNP